MDWIKKCYSRLLIDNHITDLQPKFMSKFDPEQYVAMVRRSGVKSAMVYSCDHNGNCYYPTRVGHMHANLHGRDIFGETVRLLREAGIVPVAYYTTIFHNNAAKSHPEWRARDINGVDHHGRYHYCCPNQPGFLAFTMEQLAEVAAYPVDGFFVDMTFWPLVCQCPACVEKFGGPAPETIDWNNPEWVRFQRFRERTMAEFGQRLTDHLKSLRPECSVVHQFSPVLHGWYLGQSSGIAAASDYGSGDFYGGRAQHRLGAKLLDAYTAHPPFEFMTSRCVNLNDHTSTRSEEELFLHAATTLANGGAYFFIDAINPDGTLEARTYERLGNVTRRLEPFTRCIETLRPRLEARCGLYFSMNSCVNSALDGVPLKELAEGSSNMGIRCNPLADEVSATGELLTRMKIPYRILTDRTEDWSGLDTVIVNNARYLSPEECARMREFVRRGGTLIATGMTSLQEPEGKCSGNFLLADLFGVDFTGEFTDTVSYLKTPEEGLTACLNDRCPLVRVRDAELLGTVTVPDYPANDPELYASIHSNPPGIDTDYAGLTLHRYGDGQCVYLYSTLLHHRNASQRAVGERLFRRFVSGALRSNLPPSTEVTLLRSENGSLVVALVNDQEEPPSVPLFHVELEIPCAPVKSVRRVSDGRQVPVTMRDGKLLLTLERLDEVEMFEIIHQ